MESMNCELLDQVEMTYCSEDKCNHRIWDMMECGAKQYTIGFLLFAKPLGIDNILKDGVLTHASACGYILSAH